MGMLQDKDHESIFHTAHTTHGMSGGPIFPSGYPDNVCAVVRGTFGDYYDGTRINNDRFDMIAGWLAEDNAAPVTQASNALWRSLGGATLHPVSVAGGQAGTYFHLVARDRDSARAYYLQRTTAGLTGWRIGTAVPSIVGAPGSHRGVLAWSTCSA